MLRRLTLALMLFASLVWLPVARASQPCCEPGCEAMPACVIVCALCASPAAALPAAELNPPAATPIRLGPTALAVAFDDWIDETWTPPD